MVVTVELWVEEELEELLRKARAGLEATAVGADAAAVPPGLAAAWLDDPDRDELARRLAELAAEMPPVPVEYTGYGADAGSTFLSPRRTVELGSVHARLHLALQQVPGYREAGRPGSWVPALPIVTGLNGHHLAQAIAAARGLVLPFRADLRAVAAVDRAAGRVLFEAPFTGRR